MQHLDSAKPRTVFDKHRIPFHTFASTLIAISKNRHDDRLSYPLTVWFCSHEAHRCCIQEDVPTSGLNGSLKILSM